MRTPTSRASGIDELEIVVDVQERYAWSFSAQHATTARMRLPAGDYGVLLDGRLVGTVERKGLGDLVSSLTTGKLKYQLTSWPPYRTRRWSWRTATRVRSSTRWCGRR